MKNETRLQFNELKREVASANHVQDVTEKFNLVPVVEQRLTEQLQESSEFLKRINITPVIEQKGQKLGLGIGSPIASRINTDEKERDTVYPGQLGGDDYDCKQTNSDTHLSYRTLDAWATMPNFKVLYRKALIKRMALDRVMIGWNGTHAATETDRAAYPLLEDVNVGWHEKVRLHAPERLMGYDSTGAATTDEYTIGEGGVYATLDAMAFDMVSNLLEPWYQGGDDLVLIVGRELWVNHGLSLYNSNVAATEKNALQILMATQAVAGLPTVTVPFFPARGMVITSYDNLSVYFQSGAVRRAVIDNPKRDRVEEFLSSNDAFVVEDYGKYAGVRPGAIKLKNAAGGWV